MVKWDIKLWVITILLGLTLSFGTYSIGAMNKEVEDNKQKTAIINEKQILNTERIISMKEDVKDIKDSIKDIHNLLKEHVKDSHNGKLKK